MSASWTWDQDERRTIRENVIKTFSVFEIEKHGIGELLNIVLEYIGSDIPVRLNFHGDSLSIQRTSSTEMLVKEGRDSEKNQLHCGGLT